VTGIAGWTTTIMRRSSTKNGANHHDDGREGEHNPKQQKPNRSNNYKEELQVSK